MHPAILLLHADEEVGSPESRQLTERLAAECSRVYVLEPGQGPKGAYKTARKGVGLFRIEVTGVAAHAGIDFGSGHSAVVELGRQLGVIGSFSDEKRGLTVNPGVIGGGTRSNVVAAHAWVEIDVRVASMEDADANWPHSASSGRICQVKL
jgi:glutamate carboxypeptidase